MQVQSNTGCSPIEDLITSCQPVVERLARKYVGRGPSLLDFDDYVSAAMLRIWEVSEAILAAEVPFTYACKVADNAMIAEYNKLHKVTVVSLDAPLKSDSSFSLEDTLADESYKPVRRNKRVRALNAAVRRLNSPRHRAVLRRRFGLPGYGSNDVKETGHQLGLTLSMVDHAQRNGVHALYADLRLCKTVGVEVVQ